MQFISSAITIYTHICSILVVGSYMFQQIPAASSVTFLTSHASADEPELALHSKSSIRCSCLFLRRLNLFFFITHCLKCGNSSFPYLLLQLFHIAVISTINYKRAIE